MEIIKFKPTYKREDGLTVIYDSSVPFPEGFSIKVQGIVVFPSGAKGGNHKHPRKEVLYSSGELTFIYLDKDQRKCEVSMCPENGEYKLFLIPPNFPHAVVNKSDKEVVMVEYANEEQHNVENVEIV